MPDFESTFTTAISRLRAKADRDSDDYDPEYEALVYMLALSHRASVSPVSFIHKISDVRKTA